MSKRRRYLDDNPPTVLPVNSEGLPYYNLPDIDVNAIKLPKAKATDANIQRYANAVANGEIKLTQIPDTELRNKVRAKPIVDKIIKDRDKTALPILGATVGIPAAIIGGISAAPTVATIMNNPIVDAGLTVHGAITAPKNIKEGIEEIRNNNVGRGALDLGLTALDIIGGGNLIYKGGRILNPAYRAKHAYNTISPIGYNDAGKRAKEWIKDLWNNPEIDYTNPKWYKRLKDTAKRLDEKHKGHIDRYGITGTGSYLDDDVLHAGKIADDARMDAWAMYNRLPQQHGTYIPNGDGTFSYNMEKIMKDSEGTWHPHIAPMEANIPGANNTYDFVTGAGGGLTKFEDVGELGNRVMRLEDIWDLHPFSKQGDLVSNRLEKTISENIGSQTRRDAVQKFRRKMYDKGIFGLGNKPIQKALRPVDRVLNKYRMGQYSPKLSEGYIEYKGLTDIAGHKLANSKVVNKISNKVKNIEAGVILGGKPFKMRTDIPYYYDKDALLEAFSYIDNPELYEEAISKAVKYRKQYGGSIRRSLKDGGIYIQPSHRGRFTALKERTGHSTSWFKENGTPAQKKMATFALNAAKWNH